MTERNAFLRHTQRNASLTVGESGTLRGFQSGSYGALRPHTVNGLSVGWLLANASSVTLDLADRQVDGRNRVLVGFPGADLDVPLDWNGTNERYEASNASVFTYLDANVGNAVKVRIRAPIQTVSARWTIGTNPTFNEIRGYLIAESGGPYGALSPAGFLGHRVNRLQINTANNTLILALGDTGTEQVAGADEVLLTFNGGSPVVLTWNGTSNRYDTTSTAWSALALANTGGTGIVTVTAR